MLVKGTQIYDDKWAISPWFARHWSQHCPKGHNTFINGHTIDNFYHQLPLGITTHSNNSYMRNIRFVCSIFLYLVYEIPYKKCHRPVRCNIFYEKTGYITDYIYTYHMELICACHDWKYHLHMYINVQFHYISQNFIAQYEWRKTCIFILV